MAEEYRLWVHIEQADEENDVYEEAGGPPAPAGRFDTLDEAENARDLLLDVEKHRCVRLENVHYYIRLRILWRSGEEEEHCFDLFDDATQFLDARIEDIKYHEDIQSVTIDCISAVHRRKTGG